MINPELVGRLRWHAGFRDYEEGGASIAACTWSSGADRPSDLDAAVHDVVETLGRLNLELNGPVPSECKGLSDLPRDLVYAIAEIDRMLRSYGVGVSDGARRAQAAKATWLIETAWRAVLAGDIDDLRQHLAEESVTRG
jgi:hypothetical protein